MDHVRENSSIGGAPNYSHQIRQQMNEYAVDPSLIDQTQWQQPGGPYPHQDVFNPQQGYQHQQQLQHQHQQYVQPPQPSYNNYGVSQSPVYPDASYPNIYGQQPNSSNGAAQFGVQYGGLQSHTPTHSQHPSHPRASFSTSQSPFSYSTQGPVAATISPHDLERVTPYPAPARNISTPQSALGNTASTPFRPTWNPDTEYQERQTTNLNPTFQYNPANSEDPLAYPRTDVNQALEPSASTSKPLQKRSDASNNHAPAATQKDTSSTLRITHADLLAETENIPARRFPNAPYAILGTSTIELDDKYASKSLPVWQPKPNRSGKPLIPGLENRFSMSSASATKFNKIRTPRVKKYAKSRPDPMKLQPAKSAIPRVSSSGIRISPRTSPSPTELSSEEDYTSSEEESEYTDEEEEIGDMRTLEEFRPGPRPTDFAAAAGWDATGIIYSPAGRKPTAEEKRKVATEFPLLIITLREELVGVTADLAKAEMEKRDADAKVLMGERSIKQQALVKALYTVIIPAHQDVRDTLATVDRFVVGLTNILRICIKAEDYVGDLALTIFELMSKFTKASEALLTRSKFEGIVKKFNRNRIESKDADKEEKRRHEDIKRFVESIMKNTVEAQDRSVMKTAEGPIKKEEQKNAPSPKTMEKSSKAAGTLLASGLKRPRESDGINNIPNKKVSSEGAKIAVAKPSTTKTIPLKPNDFFAKLGKPAPKPVASATPAAKAVIKKPAPVPTRPSTITALLADIQKPKEVPKLPVAPQRPPETPEEKSKRERKESRRHLRVRFKDGGDLTEIRLFKHEQSEDEGRMGDMLRDAHDDRSEGMMHKQRVQEASGMDEDDTEIEINDKPWPEFSGIDFSVLGERILKNFTTRGGQVSFKTPQQQIQDKLEETELMVVYTADTDIPYSPKEPPFEPSVPGNEKLLFQPRQYEVQQRLLDIGLYGVECVVPNIIRKAEEQEFGRTGQMRGQPSNSVQDILSLLNRMDPQQAPPAPEIQNNKPSDVFALLNAMAKVLAFQNPNYHRQPAALPQSILLEQLSSISQSNTAPTNIDQLIIDAQASSYCPPGMDPAAMVNLGRVFAIKKGLTFPATEPPEWMPGTAKYMWLEGVILEQAAKAAADKAIAEEKVKRKEEADQAALVLQLQQIIASQQQQPQQTQPPMAYPQIPGFTFPAAANMASAPASGYDPDHLQKALAGLGYVGQGGAVPAQQQHQQQVPQWPTTGPTQSNTNYDAQNAYQQMYNQATHNQPAYNQPAYNLPTYDQQAQQPSWQSEQKDAYKSDTSRHGQDTADFGNKTRWDGAEKHDKRQKDPDYKRGTKPCKFWQEGKCAKGANCTFIHD